MLSWYKNSRGIGKSIYPIRTIGYLFGALVIYLYRSSVGELDFYSFALIGSFITFPHVAFYLYKRKDCNSSQEIKTLMFDTFLVGFYINLMNFSLLPSASFLVVLFATIMGVKGIKLFIQSLITFVIGLVAGYFLINPVFDQEPPILVSLLSLAYLIIGTLGHNYFDYIRSLQFIKAKEKIKEQNAQKEVLLREVHHRVKNNLQIIYSLLNLQMDNLSDDSAKQSLRASQNRIKIMSLVHQELYKTDEVKDVNLNQYIIQLVDYLRSLNDQLSKQVETDVQVDPITLNLQTAVPLGLILNEIISNSFEHAFNHDTVNKRIWVQVEHIDDELSFVVGDNGSGWNTDNSSSSLGKNLIKDLVKQLKGTCSVDIEHGVIYSFKIPFKDE